MITFEVLCWENDYRYLLSANSLDHLREEMGFQFDFKRLLVNQVFSRSHVLYLLSKTDDFFDEVVFVEDNFKSSLKSLGVDAGLSPREAQYSRGQFVGLDRCQTKFLFHLNADIFLRNQYRVPFLSHGIEVLQHHSEILAFSPKWAFESSTGELIGENGYLLEREKDVEVGNRIYVACKGFSDNCFLVETSRLKQIDWNTSSRKTDLFPSYAGFSFEKRIANFIYNSNNFRAIDPTVTFVNREKSKNLTSRVLNQYNRYRWKLQTE